MDEHFFLYLNIAMPLSVNQKNAFLSEEQRSNFIARSVSPGIDPGYIRLPQSEK
jgi:hypothetical protein